MTVNRRGALGALGVIAGSFLVKNPVVQNAKIDEKTGLILPSNDEKPIILKTTDLIEKTEGETILWVEGFEVKSKNDFVDVTSFGDYTNTVMPTTLTIEFNLRGYVDTLNVTDLTNLLSNKHRKVKLIVMPEEPITKTPSMYIGDWWPKTK